MNAWAGIHRATIRFGTDGWRAVISDEFTFNNNNFYGLAFDTKVSVIA